MKNSTFLTILALFLSLNVQAGGFLGQIANKKNDLLKKTEKEVNNLGSDLAREKNNALKGAEKEIHKLGSDLAREKNNLLNDVEKKVLRQRDLIIQQTNKELGKISERQVQRKEHIIQQFENIRKNVDESIIDINESKNEKIRHLYDSAQQNHIKFQDQIANTTRMLEDFQHKRVTTPKVDIQAAINKAKGVGNKAVNYGKERIDTLEKGNRLAPPCPHHAKTGIGRRGAGWFLRRSART